MYKPLIIPDKNMPDSDTEKSNILFKVELIIFFVLLIGISFLSWQILSDETKKYLVSLPAELMSTYRAKKTGTGQDIPSSPQEGFTAPAASPETRQITALPEGSQTYTFSHGSTVKGPKMSTLTIDPLTPEAGTTQTLKLTAAYSSTIKGAKVEVVTDNRRVEHILQRTAGTDTESTWEGNWILEDTYDYKYGFRFILTSDAETYDDYMWLRN